MLLRCAKSNEVLHGVEKEMFGYDHCEVGAVLLNKWGLPIHLEEAVGSHHLPQKAVQNPMLAAIVHIADVVAHALKIGNSGVNIVPKLSQFAWSRFGMAATILPQVIEQLEIQSNAMLKALDMESGKRRPDAG
jgi:HD-like signal output (HDOD) protein